MLNKVIVSSLEKTWILDLDGTIVKHNGYLIDGRDTLLPGTTDFLRQIPAEDKIIFLTSRSHNLQSLTERFLQESQIRYDVILYDMPYGERILINDRKPSGLDTAIAINTTRDFVCDVEFIVDQSL